MIKQFQLDREVILFCDMHGHSRKRNVFVYGCSERRRTPALRLRERIFPMLLGRPVTRELAPVSGVEPPVAHNTLLAEDHTTSRTARCRATAAPRECPVIRTGALGCAATKFESSSKT